MRRLFSVAVMAWASVCFLGFTYCDVYASSGALKKASIKTCPDGVSYGYHGKDNHWHVAEYTPKSSSGWTAVGEPLAGDPCPDGSAGSSSSSATSDGATPGGTAEAYVAPLVAAEPVKSGENDILTLKINGDEVSPVLESMDYELVVAKFDLEIVLVDERAGYKVVGDTGAFSKNENRSLKIIVTAENGDEKVYTLNVTRKMVPGKARLASLMVGSEAVEIREDENMVVEVPSSQSELRLAYELSEPKAVLKVLKGESEVSDKTYPLKNGANDFVLMVIDEDENEYNYSLTVNRKGADVGGAILATTAIGVGAGALVYHGKKKSKK